MRFLYARTKFPALLTINFCLLLCLIMLLTCSATQQSDAAPLNHSNIKISSDTSKLPKPVQEMRTAIIKAAKSGKLDAMLPVLQRNEILPIVSFGSTQHPIDFWKSTSKDGNGKDILEDMQKIFTMPYAIEKPGTKDERYIWPYLAEITPNKLTAKQEADLKTLTSPDMLKKMKTQKRYLFYRATIGKDGTWHTYALEE